MLMAVTVPLDVPRRLLEPCQRLSGAAVMHQPSCPPKAVVAAMDRQARY